MKYTLIILIVTTYLISSGLSQNYLVPQPEIIRGTSYNRITRTLTENEIDRKLFSKQGASEWVRIAAMSGGTEDHGFSVALTTDPGWHRIVYADYDRWIKSYGDNAGDTQFNQPNGIARARLAQKPFIGSFITYTMPIYVADSGNDRVVELTMTMQYASTLDFHSVELQYRREFTGIGSSAGPLKYPIDVAYQSVGTSTNPDAGNLWVTDTGNHRVVRIRLSDGSITGTYGSYGSGEGKFIYPSRLAVEKDGIGAAVYVVDNGNQRLVKIKPVEQQNDDKTNGVLIGWSWLLEKPFNGRFYYGLYDDPYGCPWAVDELNHAIVRFDHNLNELFYHGDYGVGQTVNKLNRPVDIYRFKRNIFENGVQTIQETDISQVTEEWSSGSGQLKFLSQPRMVNNTFSYTHIFEGGGGGGGPRLNRNIGNSPMIPCNLTGWFGTDFSFKTTDSGRITAKIFDDNDTRIVKTICDNKLYQPGQVNLTWDGYDDMTRDIYARCDYLIRITFKSIYGYPNDFTNLFPISIGSGNSPLPKSSLAATGNIPEKFEVFPNYPNPFNSTTHIRYQLPERGTVKLTIYNVLGQQVKTLVNENQEPGSYTVAWQGVNDVGVVVGSGVYFYVTIFTGKQKQQLIQKMLYLK